MSRYLTKEQVVLEFKKLFLPLIKDEPIDVIEQLWEDNLKLLQRDKRVSLKLSKKWVFPKDDFNLT